MAATGDETSRIAQWLFGVLDGDATLLAAAPGGVHDEVAPPGTEFPHVRFAMLSAVDVDNQGPDRVMVDTVWSVLAVGDAPNYSTLRPAADRIAELLDRKPAPGSTIAGAVAGLTVLSSVRDGALRLADTVDGMSYRQLGGRFRIHAQLT